MKTNKSLTWVRCADQDKDRPELPCIFATRPQDPLLPTRYIWCQFNQAHYLANADRPCPRYSVANTKR